MGNRDELIDNPVKFSLRKLNDVAESLVEWVPKDVCRHLPCDTNELTTMYRCRCSFQCVWIEDRIQYAIRRNKEPVLIDHFPFANRRIQRVMTILKKCINDRSICFSSMRQNLTSVAFSAAWRDSDDSDCCLTLFYDNPITDVVIWKEEAAHLCVELNMRQITGRSRKSVLLAFDERDALIRDTIWLTSQSDKWSVSFTSPSDGLTRAVLYEKPEGAFYHPNARAMCEALEWLINRIAWISQNTHALKKGKCRLLELYCGCGAHTMAILQTNILESVVAVELDQRLVDACEKNYYINCESSAKVDKCITPLTVVSADAGVWSQKKNIGTTSEPSFDILLVDPPRQGLDEHVCRLAKNGTFQHFLYISCGRVALVRDLERLSDCFEVVDCTLLDLFPQLDAVETLLHLRRRST